MLFFGVDAILAAEISDFCLGVEQFGDDPIRSHFRRDRTAHKDALVGHLVFAIEYVVPV